MYRLLIVDDEELIVDWMYELFSSQTTMPLEIYKAYCGSDALNWMNKTRIDIMLADINMPGINGIELMKQVKRHWPQCRVVFLTAYDHFAYIYEAGKYPGVDYILKSENDAEIVRIVNRAVEELAQGLRNREWIEQADEMSAIAFPMMQHRLLFDLVEGDIEPVDTFVDRFRELRPSLDVDKGVWLVWGRWDHSPYSADVKTKNRLLHAIQARIEREFQDQLMFQQIAYERSDLIWFIQASMNRAEPGLDESAEEMVQVYVQSMMEYIQSICRESVGLTLSFAMSSCMCRWDEVPLMGQSLRRLLTQRIGQGTEMIVMGDLTDRHTVKLKDISPLLLLAELQLEPGVRSIIKKCLALSTHLEQGNREAFVALLASACECLQQIPEVYELLAMELYLAIAMPIMSYLNQHGKEASNCAQVDIRKLYHMNSHASPQEAVSYLYELTDRLFALQMNEKQSRAEQAIKDIKHYVNQHLDKELSLYSLGEAFHFNPAYLSRLFKQTTGSNVIDYINQQRIEKAKQLLAQTNWKINEIALAIGQASPNYFSRLFKKITGLVPLDYRLQSQTHRNKEQV